MPKFFSNSLKLNTTTLLIFLFILAIGIRFLYFPENIYFGFDQARDAYEAQNIYENLDLKIVGPSTASPDLFHGPFYWYLIGIPYLLGRGDPAWAAAFLILLNSAGVFLIYWLGRILFNKKAGLLAALLFAFSFEQTQYALYFGNPAPAVLTIMLFYFGIALIIFRKDWRGFPVSLLGLGLSIQFEFFLIYLLGISAIILLIFRKTAFKLLNARRILLSLMALIASVATFILADFKFGFRTTKTLLGVLSRSSGSSEFARALGVYIKRLVLQVHDNLSPFENIDRLVLILILCAAFLWLTKKYQSHRQILFLSIWILSTSILLLFGTPTLYYSNIGLSAGLILLAAYFIDRLRQRSLVLAIVVMLVIGGGNISAIKQRSPNGIINDIYVQEGMLLGREKKAVDYIYKEAEGKPIVVAALTMPLKINTTWAYLFSWYGKEKYGYLPFWAGEVAEGYPGQLPRWASQEKDYVAFSIIEPTRGVREAFIQQFLEEQEQYGGVVEEKIFGDKWYSQFVVQRRGSKKAQ